MALYSMDNIVSVLGKITDNDSMIGLLVII